MTANEFIYESIVPIHAGLGVTLRENNNWRTATINRTETRVHANWPIVRLDSIAEIKGGISAPKEFIEPDVEGAVPFIRVSGLARTSSRIGGADVDEFLPGSKYKSFPKATILIAKSGESIRQKYRRILLDDAVVVGHIAGLIPKCNPSFMFHLLGETPPEDLLLKNSTMPSLGLTELRAFEIAIPNQEQQEVITSILDHYASSIEKIKQAIEKQEAALVAIRRRLISGRIRSKVLDGQIILYKNESWKDIQINGFQTAIPDDWEVSSFQSFGAFKTGKDYKKIIGHEYPVYGSAKTSFTVRTDRSIYDKPSFILGRKGTIDKPYKVDTPFWCVDTAMYYDALDPTDRDFIFEVANSINWKSFSSGSAVPSLVQSQVNRVQFAAAPKEERNAIGQLLSKMRKAIDILENLLAKETQKFEWLRRQLLSGRLEVVEDSNR